MCWGVVISGVCDLLMHSTAHDFVIEMSGARLNASEEDDNKEIITINK